MLSDETNTLIARSTSWVFLLVHLFYPSLTTTKNLDVWAEVCCCGKGDLQKLRARKESFLRSSERKADRLVINYIASNLARLEERRKQNN
jgi:hypothetical protein